jgi:hypothetical protein
MANLLSWRGELTELAINNCTVMPGRGKVVPAGLRGGNKVDGGEVPAALIAG